MPDDPKPGFRRTFDRLIGRPGALLIATLAIIAVTAATVLLGALFLYTFDDAEFGSYGEALWFAVQTATTVGYGDVTPQRAVGRIAAAVVMLVTLGLLTVMTATITSNLVRRASRRENQSNHDEITTALTQLEASVLALGKQLDDLRNDVSMTDPAAHAPGTDGAGPAPSVPTDQ